MIDVTAAVIIDNHKLLIAQRKEADYLANKWELPGGKKEENESLEQCLKRELKEEFDIDATIGNYVLNSIYKYPHYSINLVAFEVVKYKGEISLNSHKDIKWITKEEIDNYNIAEADQPIIDEIIQRSLI